uniref:MAX dimerization protein 1 n=1 Tax=Taeniopygia guttata TaxID=59729 RepID=A0A674GEP1_TAEGU
MSGGGGVARAGSGGAALGMLLEAAEFLERRERGTPRAPPPFPVPPVPPAGPREAEHGYASLWPGGKDGEAPRRRAKARRSGGAGGRSTHNEMEKNRRAQLRRCLERLKGLVPLGTAAGRHTTLSLLTRARLHIQKLEDQEHRALHQIEQLQREQRHLQRQLEKLGMERVRIDSIGSSLCSERSESDQGEPQSHPHSGMWRSRLLEFPSHASVSGTVFSTSEGAQGLSPPLQHKGDASAQQ